MLTSKDFVTLKPGFTDLGDRKLKLFCPTEKAVKILLGSGQEGTNDGTEETCFFT